MKQLIRYTFVFIFITFLACKALNNSAPANISTLIFQLETTACYGKCPVYKLEIYSDGKVLLFGKENIDYIGNFESSITMEKLEQLTKAFENASFFEFNDEYRSLFKDLPTKYISFHYNDISKTIKAYDNIPDELNNLIRILEDLVNELDWKIIH